VVVFTVQPAGVPALNSASAAQLSGLSMADGPVEDWQ
jgi:hypothetical protein